MRLDEFNDLAAADTEAQLLRCCASQVWAAQMAAARPFGSTYDVLQTADHLWDRLATEDWLEAFTHHPRIGDVEQLREKFSGTEAWAREEQSGAQGASDDVLRALAQGNNDYETRFGFIFLVFATGKSAPEMLALLEARMSNSREMEIAIAAGEQSKITRLRLERLIQP